MKTTVKWDDLDDYPAPDEVALDPYELLNSDVIKSEDRSRNPENWAL